MSATLKSDAVKELHALGEEASVKEAGRKASIWWNQKGSEAARMKEKWLEDNKKRPASAPSDEPAPKNHPAALTVNDTEPTQRGGLFTEGLQRGDHASGLAMLSLVLIIHTKHKTSRVTERSSTSRARLFPEHENP